MRAQQKYQHQLSRWQGQRDAYEELVALAKDFEGESSSDIVLKPGETVFARVTGASLEDRQDLRRSVTRPRGIPQLPSFALRYRVGAHSRTNAQRANAVDVGTICITNERVVFQGAREIREFGFDRLLGFQHDSKRGKTVFSVSDQPKPTTLHYGASLVDWFAFRLALALSHYRNEMPALVRQLEGGLAALDARKPQPPPGG
jgi:hypothetical protein